MRLSVAAAREEVLHTLEAKLGAAATKILKGEPGRRIMQRIDDLERTGVMATGRWIYRQILKEFVVDEKRTAVSGYSQLMAVQWLGDEKVATFQANWVFAESALTKPVPDEMKEVISHTFSTPLSSASQRDSDVGDRYERYKGESSGGFRYNASRKFFQAVECAAFQSLDHFGYETLLRGASSGGLEFCNKAR